MNLPVFMKEFEFSASAVSAKTSIPVLANVLIDRNKGVTTITGTDLEVAAVTAFRSDPGGLRVTVPSKRLRTVLKALNRDQSFDLSCDGHAAKLSAGSFSSTIAGMSPESYPELPKLPETMIPVPLNPLLAALKATQHSISKEESRFTLNGSLLMISASGDVLSVATDGHRLTVARHGESEIRAVDSKTYQHRFLVPNGLLRLLPQLGDADTCMVGLNDSHGFFLTQFKDRSFRLLLGRKLTGNFPDYERVVPKNPPISLVVNRKALLDSCVRLLPLSDERSRCGSFTFSGAVGGGSVKIGVSLAETGDARDIVTNCQIPLGTHVEAGFNLSFMVEGLNTMISEEVTIKLKDKQSPMTIVGEADHGVTVTEVVMPIRI